MGKSGHKKIILAEPRGFCAGVRRALETVEQALKAHGAPVFVLHEIVHNRHVVEGLRDRGVIFIEDVKGCPKDRPLIFSAHGVSAAVEKEALDLGLKCIDATCPLVKKIHRETEKYSRMGCKIIIIGHSRHPEVVGVRGHASGEVFIVEGPEDVRKIPFASDDKVACFSQTTLDTKLVAEIIGMLRLKYPVLTGSPEYDVCYATRNRQNAIRKVAGKSDLVLIIGSRSSSNSLRLCDAARKLCGRAHLLENSAGLNEKILEGAEVIGISAGASAPEYLVEELVSELRRRGWPEAETLSCGKEEQSFKIPAALIPWRQA